ncbi:hypothetical protein [Natrialbaceae archaeon AArc-T1-2]|uniref:hypothetical protein n=1 Tax=Natrialbaceae archaeon AArc-T1-2 TaxID=3053904 RepID=UPI00255AB5C8|nr:hypothetical protein [Natrialbaceae archaeon AArc-T1-2]WIV67556.1 hypothetical protein QQ977_02160 [Natrialbaceae archaeon AArc-T1-2]
MSTDSSNDVPSNHELSERMTRIEQKLDHVADLLERMEGDVEEDLEDVEDELEDIKPKTSRLWLLYRAGKWTTGLLVGSGIAAAAVTTVF